ncbi:hypothetical protein GGX14DRAFT_575640 [Mycena pura]|uniref:Uncharacterized protein n=1 Tax=Mycena pura TaxID=153505 RepID=A0AAD6UVB4_9AGAR|nr:hypothetical protein GGX14DRAFT_575640 [Mycena pura]
MRQKNAACNGRTSLSPCPKNVLDNSNSGTVANNPVISQIFNSPETFNQQWQFNLNATTGFYTIGNGVSGGNALFLSYPAATTPNMLKTFDQASMQLGGQALNFIVDCTGSNTAFILDAVFETALTSWAQESSTITPVTYEGFDGRPEQVWTFLD